MAKAKAPCDLMKAARRKLGRTQADIANECGVWQPLISRWESGAAPVPPKHIRRVARAYRLQPEQLIPSGVV